MKKQKYISILIGLILIFGLAAPAQASSIILVPANTETLVVPVEIANVSSAIAGVQFSIKYPEGLDYVKFDLTPGIASTKLDENRLDQRIVHLGFWGTSNNVSPTSNKMITGNVTFRYTSRADVTINTTNIKLVRVRGSGSGSATESEQRGDSSFTFRRQPGNGNSGGTFTTPPILIGVDDGNVPLASAFAPFINGFEDGTIRPNGTLSRAQLAQMIYNLYGDKDMDYASTFNDIRIGQWYYTAIAFCEYSGYMLGYPDGSFKPSNNITRAELATTFARMRNLTLTSAHPFSDVDDKHWANEYIGAVYAAELMLGYPNGTFRPDAGNTRAEAVTVIIRAEGRDHTLYDTTRTFPDLNDPKAWYYDYMMHAANGYTG